MMAKLVNCRPPRIAMTLLCIAAAVHWLLPLPQMQLFRSWPPGLFLGVPGFGVMLWAWWQFRQHRVAICPTAKTDYLITDGIYGYSRNPMYLGILMMLCGIALWAGTLPFVLAASGFYLVIEFAFCPYEEEKLTKIFGQAYLNYRNKVRRWF